MAVLYDYECPKCKHTFEEFRAMEERESCECPKCGVMADKIMTVGSGWMNDVDGVNARVERDVGEMQKKINKKDEKFIHNFRGAEKGRPQ